MEKELKTAPIAVIDLGTNTFNLGVYQRFSNGKFQILHAENQSVGLRTSGINFIDDDATQRAIQVLRNYKITCQKFGALSITCVGTSAIRSATNGQTFTEKIFQELQLHIRIVSGVEEAQLIKKGVLAAFPDIRKSETQPIILDIGGGSCEFIKIGKTEESDIAISLEMGMARIYHQYPFDDVPTSEAISSYENFFKEQLLIAKTQLDLEIEKTYTLIGCAGTFDTLDAWLNSSQHQESSYQFLQETIENAKNQLLTSTKAFRTNIPGIIPIRTQMIVPAIILISQLMKDWQIKELVGTSYSLREGVV